MSLYESISQDLCYICQKETDNLVSPCGNSLHENVLREIKTDRECLQNMIKCPKCSNPIIVSKIEKFDLYNFLYDIFIILLFILTYISGAVLPGIIMMGTLINGHLSDSGGDFILALILAVVVGCFYIGSFWAYYVREKLYNNEDNSYFLFIMFITSLGINVFIFLCHFFGFIILLIYSNKYYYTSYSFCVGFTFCIVLTIAVLFILFIFFSCRHLYYKNVKEETVLGV